MYPWLKQRYLYRQPPLEGLNTQFVKVTSTAALVLTTLGGLTIGCTSIVPNRYRMDPQTMQFMVANNEPKMEAWRKSLKVLYYLASCGSALIQLYLFALLARPLRDYKKNKKAQSCETSKKVVRTLTQAVVSFVVCSLATIVLGFLGEYVGLKENIRCNLVFYVDKSM